MTITVSAFVIVLVVFMLHTILSHLLNWALRGAFEIDDGNTGAVVIFAFIVEAVIVIAVLYSILS